MDGLLVFYKFINRPNKSTGSDYSRSILSTGVQGHIIAGVLSQSGSKVISVEYKASFNLSSRSYIIL